MKKEEIDERLMDALLRGKGEDDLAGMVEEEMGRRAAGGFDMRKVLAWAAVVVISGGLGFFWFSRMKNGSQTTETLVAEYPAGRPLDSGDHETLGMADEIREAAIEFERSRKVLEVIERIQSGVAENRVTEIEKEQLQATRFLAELDNLSDDDSLLTAAGNSLCQPVVHSLRSDYMSMKREADDLEKANGNPEEIVARRVKVAALRGALKEALLAEKNFYRTRSEMLAEQLVSLSKTSDETRVQLANVSINQNEIKDALDDYRASAERLRQLEGISGRSGNNGGQNSLSAASNKASVLPSPSMDAAVHESHSEIEQSESQRSYGDAKELGMVSDSVRITGKVHFPGVYRTHQDLTLGELLSRAGGITESGSERRVYVQREGRNYHLNLENQRLLNERLFPGDSVMVEPWRFEEDNQEKQIPENEKYQELIDQPWKSPLQEALSTFSVDVDTASYANIRRMIREGRKEIPADAVRVEELVNYFDYDYPQPADGEAFGVGLAMATCPWKPDHHLVRVALQGREVARDQRPPANLVFLVDVSGSMQASDKLSLLVESMTAMLEELREDDRVGIVAYAGSEGVVLPSTRMTPEGRTSALAAMGNLQAGGSTNGGAGIRRAYALAKEGFVKGGVNRVVLATDGDFNVGVTGQEALVDLVKGEAKNGIFLSVCGFGSGNLNDAMLEAVTNGGNGVYYYIDSIQEGRRIFMQKLSGTLVAIAKDVKVQVEFNPGKVAKYRLIGYANRILKKEDFNDDKVDAGDIGAGHQVTAFYEILPVGVADTTGGVDPLKYQAETMESPALVESDEWLTVKLRHKQPDGDESRLQVFPFAGAAKPWPEMDEDFRFAVGVAWWGENLRARKSLEGPMEILSAATKDRDERRELLEFLGDE